MTSEFLAPTVARWGGQDGVPIAAPVRWVEMELGNEVF